MSQRKFVFSQVMEFFPRWVLEKAIKEYKGDFHAKNLNTYIHCLHLIFGQMAGCKSLKDISLVLRSIKRSSYHLGIQTVVDPSSLSKANETRDYRIFEDLGMWLIRKVRPMYAKEDIPNVYLPGWEIFAIDSTTIPCSIKLVQNLIDRCTEIVLRFEHVGVVPIVYVLKSVESHMLTSCIKLTTIPIAYPKMVPTSQNSGITSKQVRREADRNQNIGNLLIFS